MTSMKLERYYGAVFCRKASVCDVGSKKVLKAYGNIFWMSYFQLLSSKISELALLMKIFVCGSNEI